MTYVNDPQVIAVCLWAQNHQADSVSGLSAAGK